MRALWAVFSVSNLLVVKFKFGFGMRSNNAGVIINHSHPKLKSTSICLALLKNTNGLLILFKNFTKIRNNN